MKEGTKKALNHVGSLLNGLIWKKNPAVGLGIGIVKGAVNQVKGFVKKNVDSPVAGEGNIDFAEIIGALVGGFGVVFMAYQVYIGAISVDDFIDFFMKYLKKLG